jgi:hypothetical protein
MTTLRIAELLEAGMGLHPASIGMAGVERAVAERVRALGLAGADAYWDALHSMPGERQALIEAVVIPETWFFRDPAAFGAMAREAMARPAPLRILSLPCSTGRSPIRSPWLCSTRDCLPNGCASMPSTSAPVRSIWRGWACMGAIPFAAPT